MSCKWGKAKNSVAMLSLRFQITCPRQSHRKNARIKSLVSRINSVSCYDGGHYCFFVDGMLPAPPQIATDLSPDAPKRAEEIVVWVMIGMGVGTFVDGPLSDDFGRRKVIIIGFFYIVIRVITPVSSSLEIALTARFSGTWGCCPKNHGPSYHS